MIADLYQVHNVFVTMLSARPSDCFKLNIFIWNIFGFWPGTTNSNCYKYYSATFLFIQLILFNFLLTINLIYTPLKIDLFINEIMFVFTGVAANAKILMILRKRVEILELFEYLDCNTFEGDDDIAKRSILKSLHQYQVFHRAYAFCAHVGFTAHVLVPFIKYLLGTKSVDFPGCKCYFLSDNFRDTYFVYLYIYQAFGIYVYLTTAINVDSFISGTILMAITQLKVINYQMSNWKLNSTELTWEKDVQETIFISKLNESLRHYELVLK